MRNNGTIKGVALFNDLNHDTLPLLQTKKLERRVAEKEGIPTFLFSAEWLKRGETIPDPKRINALSILVTQEDQKIDSLEGYELLTFSFIGYNRRMMSGAVDRKVAIDETYMSQAEQFEDQLRRRNAAASRAYSQARSAEFRT